MQKGGQVLLKKLAVSVIIFTLSILTVGCGSKTNPVAIVNGMEISRADYDAELEFELYGFEQQGYQLKEEELEMVKEQVLDRLINNRLLLQAAEQAGISPDSVNADAELVEIIAGFESEEEFQAALKQSGFTLEVYTRLIAEYLMIEDLFEAELNISALTVSDEEVQTAVAEFMASISEEDAEDLDPEDVKEYFAYSLVQDKANQLKGDFIQELRENSEIEYLDL